MKVRSGFSILLFVFVLFPVSAFASTWAKSYNGNTGDYDYEHANSIQQTSDGGFIVAGDTDAFGAGDSDFCVLKLDADGNVTWQKTYGGSSVDLAYSIQQTSDGGFILAGETSSYGHGDYDAWVLKLNSTGGVTWQHTYGGSSSDRANSIQQTSDGGFIVAGRYEYDWFSNKGDFWVLKLNSLGAVTWQNTYGGSQQERADSIQQTSDGGFIVAGHTYSLDDGMERALVLKLNSTGNVIWQKSYGSESHFSANSIQQTSDGGYIVAGYVLSNYPRAWDFWVLKLTSTGSVSWQKTYDMSIDDYGQSIQQTSDGGFIVASHNLYDLWVLKLNNTGNIPGCDLIENTSVVPANTNAIPVTTNILPEMTNSTIGNTSVLSINSAFIFEEQCFDDEPQFVDVPPGYWAEEFIYKIYSAGITKGCSQDPLKYCPYDPVTRAQMAAFIVRAVEGEPPANYCATGSPFSDVSSNTWPCKYIKRLLELEITQGCGPGIYCPNNNVTRAQMAAFLIRAIEGEPPTDYCDIGSPFSDVSSDTWPCKYIKRLSELGITKGCGGTNYCPNRSVTRAEMAAFLARAFLEVILSDALYSPATGHWYQLNDTRMEWDEPKAFAEYKGGYLATITSGAEGQWLYDAFGPPLSIVAGRRTFGGNDVATEGLWQWITGETWSYTNWYAGEPNDYGGNKDCVAFHSNLRPGHGHTWNDVPTDVEYRSLIECDSNPN